MPVSLLAVSTCITPRLAAAHERFQASGATLDGWRVTRLTRASGTLAPAARLSMRNPRTKRTDGNSRKRGPDLLESVVVTHDNVLQSEIKKREKSAALIAGIAGLRRSAPQRKKPSRGTRSWLG